MLVLEIIESLIDGRLSSLPYGEETPWPPAVNIIQPEGGACDICLQIIITHRPIYEKFSRF